MLRQTFDLQVWNIYSGDECNRVGTGIAPQKTSQYQAWVPSTSMPACFHLVPLSLASKCLNAGWKKVTWSPQLCTLVWYCCLQPRASCDAQAVQVYWGRCTTVKRIQPGTRPPTDISLLSKGKVYFFTFVLCQYKWV